LIKFKLFSCNTNELTFMEYSLLEATIHAYSQVKLYLGFLGMKVWALVNRKTKLQVPYKTENFSKLGVNVPVFAHNVYSHIKTSYATAWNDKCPHVIVRNSNVSSHIQEICESMHNVLYAIVAYGFKKRQNFLDSGET